MSDEEALIREQAHCQGCEALRAERDRLLGELDASKSAKVMRYMRVVANGRIEDEDSEDERDAIWAFLNQSEKDEANRLVVSIFGV